MKKIKTIIVEDEPKASDILVRYIEGLAHLELLGNFRNPVKALEFVSVNKVDLIFLDINMPSLSGIELLKSLKDPPAVVFTTAYTDYAVESYEYDALDYLLKPISFSRFLQAISKVQKLMTEDGIQESKPSNDKVLYIKSGPQTHKLRQSEILFLEKDGNYIVFHTKNKKILSRQNMRDVFDLLDPSQFLRIHKSFIVNKAKVEIIESDKLVINNHKIAIGRSYKGDVDKAFHE